MWPLTARGSNQNKLVDPTRLHLLFPPTLAVRSNITCKEEKDAIQLVLAFLLGHGSTFFFLCFGSALFLVSPSSLLRCSLLVAAPAVDSRLEMGPLLWAPLEEEGLLLAGEEAGRRRLASVEAVAAEEMMGTALWWRNSAAVMGFSRCGWRLEGK